jgi:glutamate-1-semialdehyde 2,1-aminomutase
LPANGAPSRHLSTLLAAETRRFEEQHPRSQALFARARGSLLDGVPMHWMRRWPGGFPLFVASAQGGYLTDVDGHRYLDLCLGDTAAMSGHAPAATVGAIHRQAERGSSTMLPTEDGVWVAEELARRFGLPQWQLALTATDANRFALRLARMLTGRSRILVFNWCYHGTVDETFVTLQHGVAGARAGNIGPAVDPALTTRVVEFNDLPALDEALSHRDVACVLAEPAMTNIGIILPDPGFHQALRDLTRRAGTLLILDETHTICAGPGGYTGEFGLEPDFLTIGKPIAGGVPGAAYGFTTRIAEEIRNRIAIGECDTGGIGGTLAGNALSSAAMRATLEQVLTPESYGRSIPLADRFRAGVERVIAEFELPWIVKQLGCRVEYWFRPVAPRNGGEAAAAMDPELEQYMHLAALNRGVLLTPFHNMALIAPDLNEADIDHHTSVFRESVQRLVSGAGGIA